MGFQEIVCDVLDWIQLTEDRVQSRALVNIIMNLWFRKSWGIS
jgi:hypothetical protein